MSEAFSDKQESQNFEVVIRIIKDELKVAEVTELSEYLTPEFEGFFNIDIKTFDFNENEIRLPEQTGDEYHPKVIKLSVIKGGELLLLFWVYKESGKIKIREIIGPNQAAQRRAPIPKVSIGQTLLIETTESIAYKLKITAITREAVWGKLNGGPENGRICILKVGEEGYFCKTKTGIIESIEVER